MDECTGARDDACMPAGIGASDLEVRAPCKMRDHGIQELFADHLRAGSIVCACRVYALELRPQPGKVRRRELFLRVNAGSSERLRVEHEIMLCGEVFETLSRKRNGGV